MRQGALRKLLRLKTAGVLSVWPLPEISSRV